MKPFAIVLVTQTCGPVNCKAAVCAYTLEHNLFTSYNKCLTTSKCTRLVI